jgi:hypothetical protein
MSYAEPPLTWRSGSLPKSSAKKTNVDDRIVALLEQIAGVGKGHALLNRLMDGESPEQVAKTIAASAAFERLYKGARTLDVGVEGPKEADPAFVGLPKLASDVSFEEQFRQYFAPRLGKRTGGFEGIFRSLRGSNQNLLVIETGCMRIPGNWEGDGQSTFMLDALVSQCGGAFFSIDVTLESIDTARRACSSTTNLILNDSVVALHSLSQQITSKASLLYLDSFDFDIANPLPSAIHHILELTAARPLIASGTIVCVDDYELGSSGGKGMILDKFFSSIRAEILHLGYQKAWRVP